MRQLRPEPEPEGLMDAPKAGLPASMISANAGLACSTRMDMGRDALPSPARRQARIITVAEGTFPLGMDSESPMTLMEGALAPGGPRMARQARCAALPDCDAGRTETSADERRRLCWAAGA